MSISKSEELASYLKLQQLHAVRSLRQAEKVYPRLAIITDGSDLDYIQFIEQAARDVAVEVEVHTVSSKEGGKMLALVENSDTIQGIVVVGLQDAVSPKKDIAANTDGSVFEEPRVIAARWLEAAYSSIGEPVTLKREDVLVVTALLDNLIQACRRAVR